MNNAPSSGQTATHCIQPRHSADSMVSVCPRGGLTGTLWRTCHSRCTASPHGESSVDSPLLHQYAIRAEIAAPEVLDEDRRQDDGSDYTAEACGPRIRICSSRPRSARNHTDATTTACVVARAGKPQIPEEVEHLDIVNQSVRALEEPANPFDRHGTHGQGPPIWQCEVAAE